jgi:hypothetical protein
MTDNIDDEFEEAFGRDEGKKKPKPMEYIQKISNIVGYPDYKLVESILINGISHFLISNGSNITIQRSIELDNKILKPFESNSYLNKAYSFSSKEEVQEYIQRAKSETFDTLYDKVKTVWKKYIETDDFHLTICAADTIFTYFQDKIGLTHYLFFVGGPGSGKSNNLTVFQYLAYRNMTSTGLSYANIYQFLGSGEEGMGTICEDEADNIDLDLEKMRIYKNGYTTGRPTAKTDTTYGRKQLKFNNFCFKAFAAERLPDLVKAKGFNQRIIEMPCTYGFPQYDISEVVNPAGEQEFQELLDEIMEVRNLLLIYRLMHFAEPIPNIKLNLINREKQLFKPVLRVFQKTETLRELLPVISKYASEKRESNANSYQAFLFRTITALVNKAGFSLDSSDIVEKVITDLECEPIPGKPQSFVSREFGYLSVKSIIQTLKEVFGAKKPKRHDEPRKLIFDPVKMAKAGKIFELDIEVKVTEGADASDASDAFWKPVTEYGNKDNGQLEHEIKQNIDTNEVNNTDPYTNNVSDVSDVSEFENKDKRIE